MTRHIVGLGGGLDAEERERVVDYIAALASRERVRVCYLPTAVGDSSEAIVRFYDGPWPKRGEPSHVKVFPWPPAAVREHLLGQDVIVVSGGNTANLLALWRLHGLDDALGEAWENGVVLTGGSAGMICWFEACVTDSFGPQLEGLQDGLGFLPGSACPHYDSEELRRPTYRRLVDEGFPPGVAADDGVAIHFEGTELAEVVSARPGAGAYRVEPGAETPLAVRLL